MRWEILDTGVNSAEENMHFDSELLEQADTFSRPVLHLYEWQEPSATYGYFTDPSKFLDLEEAQKQGIKLARRPTGGGIIFHHWDLAFSAVVPAHCPEFSMNTLDNYDLINRAVLAAVKEFLQGRVPLSITPEDFQALDAHCNHFCMAKPTKYDVMWEGKKIAGAAQRKTKKGFLHQGTISLMMPPEEDLARLLLSAQVLEGMKTHTCHMIKDRAEMGRAKEALKELLARHLNQVSLEYCEI